MDEVILDMPKPQRLTELHVWIGIYPNGDERMLKLEIHPGCWNELYSPDRDYAERVLRPVAEEAAQDSRGRGGMRIELRTFRMVTS
jgi:hypothetical protein